MEKLQKPFQKSLKSFVTEVLTLHHISHFVVNTHPLYLVLLKKPPQRARA